MDKKFKLKTKQVFQKKETGFGNPRLSQESKKINKEHVANISTKKLRCA